MMQKKYKEYKMDSLVINIESIRMQNESNGFVIFMGSDFNTGEDFGVKGYGYNLSEGDIVECKGIWKMHPKFGKQFDAKEISLYTPTTEEEVLKYLESGYIRGIRKPTARKIFNMFGKDSLKILDNNPTELNKVSGIGPKTVDKIVKDWNEKRIVHKQNSDLQELGFSFEESMKLLRLLGDNALKSILDNPYCVLQAEDLKITFDKIDNIAINKLRYEKENETRILSYLIYALKENELQGNTYIEQDEFLTLAKRKLYVKLESVDLLCEVGVIKKLFKMDYKNGKNIIQNYETYKVELTLAKKLKSLINAKKKSFHKIDLKIKNFETNTFKLSKEQKQAIKDSLSNNVNIINGGPGVGKTTTLDILVKILKSEGYSYSLCAFTGKAAQRMSESTNEEANTIHRTLEYNPSVAEFQKNNDNPIDSDFVIIDEASMIDVFLLNKLLKAVRLGTTIIIIGDVDQIPSISAGCILRDMINSKKINVSKITELQRQAKNSKIIKNAYLVNDGNFIEYENKKGDDFYFIKTSSDLVTLEKIKQMISTNIPKAFNLNPKNDLQLLTPTHKKILGRKSLNEELQEILNPNNSNKRVIKRGEVEFREKDNVIQIKNNYDNNVMNGDSGRIESIGINMLDVTFSDDLIEYKRDSFDEIELSYAITMHKSQGSEYPLVIIPISHASSYVMDRSLLYTAMTRGKVIVIMLGSEKQLKNIIKNDFSRKRKTCLQDRIMEEMN